MLKTLGKYKILEKIGTGGYGTIFKVEDTESKKVYAAKAVLSKKNPDQTDALKHEFRILNETKKHENIIQVYESGVHKTIQYFIMDFLPGIDMQDYLFEKGRVNPKIADKVVLETSRGLEAIQQSGYVHRDIKPENLFFSRGKIRIIDFGLAYDPFSDTFCNSKDDIFGTPYYVAPEYIDGDQGLTIKYDIYSLGITWFYLLAAKYPFTGRSTADIFESHLEDRVPSIRKLHPKRKKLMHSMLEKKPENRPNPEDVIKEIESEAWKSEETS